MSCGRGDLQLMGGMPPLASALRPRGGASLRAMNSPYPQCGDIGHLRLPVKHNEYFLYVIECIRNLKTQLAGVAADTLCENAKAHPQQ
jgi:hypothetical protein